MFLPSEYYLFFSPRSLVYRKSMVMTILEGFKEIYLDTNTRKSENITFSESII